MFGDTTGKITESISFREHPDPGDEIEVYFPLTEMNILFNRTTLQNSGHTSTDAAEE